MPKGVPATAEGLERRREAARRNGLRAMALRRAQRAARPEERRRRAILEGRAPAAMPMTRFRAKLAEAEAEEAREVKRIADEIRARVRRRR